MIFLSDLINEAQMLVEKSWNAFPKCKSVYSVRLNYCKFKFLCLMFVSKCPFFDKFSMTIISDHSNEGGEIENILKLSDKDLKARKVEVCNPRSKLAYSKLIETYIVIVHGHRI